MDIRLIKFFHAALTQGPHIDAKELNKTAMQAGYLIHPDCCNVSTQAFINSERINPNSTFYKTWKDVTDKHRLELLIDQLIHYISTYGTDFEGQPYIPNDSPVEIDYNSYTIIQPITQEELFARCLDMVKSGIALDQETLKSITQYISNYIKTHPGTPLCLEDIKNRDAMCLISDSLGIWPVKGEDIIRVLFYKIFDNPMPIQGKMQMAMLRDGWKKMPDLSNMLDEQKIALASVFRRYKKFLLTFKQNPHNIRTINQISRWAKKYHQPFRAGYWESLTSRSLDHNTFLKKLPELDNNFKIVRLIQMLQQRENLSTHEVPAVYTIRNGSIYTKQISAWDRVGLYSQDLDWIKNMLINQLAENLRLKLGVHLKPYYVKFPEGLELACPVSEKKFLGNLPFGSYIDMKDSNNYFGIYWREEWGAHDLDLSFLDKNGNKIGWNENYYNRSQSIVFSGDMTSARPEASEVILCKSLVPDGLVKVNLFSGQPKSRFRWFIGQDECKDFNRNYMVNPNSIRLQEELAMNSGEQCLGVISQNRFYITVVGTGNRAISSYRRDIMDASVEQVKSYLPLKQVLLKAGVREWTSELNQEPDLDLTNLSKDTLIQLFK